ncbi:HPr family phosphocarrier protein [Tepidibacter formicigenes]|jgi:phosphocarrier protein|uniref:Phosphocarrier protein n=1 Tax=Tepidibacter formicigenes DSM 15518 TaxID=1123349 RepID=A0A1M6KJE8_9FIRM|nr:HPr family phosphocarrier protein [Tepidibacter formicigenes]SHJ59029.1 phosphocarrier protein [Tepidibacter formicigenes DSM 15518]
MLEKKIIVKEQNGLHARPAGAVVKIAGEFKSRVYIDVNGKKANAKSIMGVMSLGVKENQEITIIVDGEDEGDALNALVKLIESNFEI